jgi:hypothetical protein
VEERKVRGSELAREWENCVGVCLEGFEATLKVHPKEEI